MKYILVPMYFLFKDKSRKYPDTFPVFMVSIIFSNVLFSFLKRILLTVSLNQKFDPKFAIIYLIAWILLSGFIYLFFLKKYNLHFFEKNADLKINKHKVLITCIVFVLLILTSKMV